MKKKSMVGRFTMPRRAPVVSSEEWHNGFDLELHLYAKSLQRSAQRLLATLDLSAETLREWDTAPVILLYKEAVELQLKAVIGEGSNFLKMKTDHVTLSTTHSIRWMAQIVCQIIKKVGWEGQFQCAGISTLANFSALIKDLDAVDPVSCVRYSDRGGALGDVPPGLRKSDVVALAPKLDVLLDLLDATADALAATWDLRNDRRGFKAIVH